MGALLNLVSAFGLATASGLNAYLPLFTVGLFARLGWIQLSSPFDWLAHPLVLLIIAALAVLDFAGDKIPAVDSLLHAVGLVIHPIAGAILFVAANGDVGSVNPWLAAGAGLVVGGATHALRATARPVFTTATGGTANPVVSLVEDIAALGLTLLSILVPVVAAIALAVLIFLAVRFFRSSARTWRKARSNGAKVDH